MTAPGRVYHSTSTWQQPMPPAPSPTRAAVLDHIVERMLRIGSRRIRVAVDGRTGAGKTTLAHELAERRAATGRDVLRASLDDFKRPWKEAHLYDRMSGEGYYRNAFDRDAIRRLLLDPAQHDPAGALRSYCWEMRIWVDSNADLALQRGMARDADLEGGRTDAEALHRDRYLAAETIYLEEADPVALADVVVDNRDFDRPLLLRR